MLIKPDGTPFKLLTVNTAPERAFRLVGRVANDLKASDTLLLEHVGNAASIEEVKGRVEELRPDLLMCASMWSPEQSSQIFEIGRSILGEGLMTHAIPQGMQVEKGPDFVVEYLKETLPGVVNARESRKL